MGVRRSRMVTVNGAQWTCPCVTGQFKAGWLDSAPVDTTLQGTHVTVAHTIRGFDATKTHAWWTACRSWVLLGLSVCLMTVLLVPGAWAAFPDRPLKLVVPFSPGGGTDSITRALAVGMAQGLGQSVVVENKPGAGTVIGSDFVAKSAPDGYVLVMATFAHAVNPSLVAKLPFDTERAFAAVGMVARGPNVLVVRTDSALKSLRDVLDLARAQPGKLSYPSQGNGTSAHLAGEMFDNLARVRMTHIPYRGAGPAMSDLLGGQVDMMFATAAAVAPHIASGRLRALAVTSSERSAALPQVPTVAEWVPGYSVESWYGLLAPAGTPPEVIARLHAAMVQATQTPEFKRKLEPEGLVVDAGSPAELDAYIRREEARWRRIVKDNHIKPD
jgi:tripartite-type tricarboxylate transporter receptor subunit TctC